jgi:hypothetical protein
MGTILQHRRVVSPFEQLSRGPQSLKLAGQDSMAVEVFEVYSFFGSNQIPNYSLQFRGLVFES